MAERTIEYQSKVASVEHAPRVNPVAPALCAVAGAIAVLAGCVLLGAACIALSARPGLEETKYAVMGGWWAIALGSVLLIGSVLALARATR